MKKIVVSGVFVVVFSLFPVAGCSQMTMQSVGGSNPRPQSVGGSNPRPTGKTATSSTIIAILAAFGLI